MLDYDNNNDNDGNDDDDDNKDDDDGNNNDSKKKRRQMILTSEFTDNFFHRLIEQRYQIKNTSLQKNGKAKSVRRDKIKKVMVYRSLFSQKLKCFAKN